MNLKIGTNAAIAGLSLNWLLFMHGYIQTYLSIQARLRTASIADLPSIPQIDWSEWGPNLIGRTAMVFGLLSFLMAVRNTQQS